MIIVLFLIILTLSILYLYAQLWWRRKSLPPGQFPIPLLGNFPHLMWNAPGYKTLEAYKEKYGPIYTFWFGPKPAVCIADFTLLKETFVKDGDTYSDKVIFEQINKFMRGGNYGIVDCNGPMWREHRRFALHQLRDLGLGKMKMEERILDEIPDLLKLLEEEQGKEIQMQRIFRRSIGNVINQVLFGYSFRGNKAHEFEILTKMFTDIEELFGNPAIFIMAFFPFLKKLPWFSRMWAGIVQFKEVTFGFFEQQIKEHENEIDFNNSYSTDYVEAYLKEKREREQQGDYVSFSDMQLRATCFDLWVAAFETTSATSAWIIAFLVNYPKVQKKMQDEMDAHHCKGRLITNADKNDLPYTQAVILESQRLANIVPLNLLHKANRDVIVNGFKIEEGTAVIAQISSLLYDPQVFPEPQEFKPERFIDDGEKIKKYEQFLPFSIGKRACPGEGLAKMELFLFIANIFNKFTILPDGEAPTLIRSKKSMQRPVMFKYTLEKRF